MKWWNNECYICYRSFNSTTVPRIKFYNCKHDICEDCVKDIQKGEYKDYCCICRSNSKYDISYRLKKNKKTQDIFQRILICNEFPDKIKLNQKTGFINTLKKIFNKK